MKKFSVGTVGRFFLKSILSLASVRLRRVIAELNDANAFIETTQTTRGAINFNCPDALPLWRARTLLTKEPETIEWIDSFSDGDVYWDVGANVGAYALYAAINRRVQVLAFEPSAANYFLLNRNIELNRLGEVLRAYCLAFSDTRQIDVLHMQSTEFGGALSSFSTPVDNDGKMFSAKFQQGMVGFSIDDFVQLFNPPFPNHLKIDVDGIEDRIIMGAPATLADSRLKSVSIELDSARPDYTDSVVGLIEAGGLRLSAKRHAEIFDNGIYRNIYNYQFRR